MMRQFNHALDSRRLLREESDIRALLNKIYTRNNRITASYGNKQNTFSTSLLDIGETYITLDNPCSPATEELVLSSSGLILSTICSTAPVNFVASRITASLTDGKSAFIIPFPRSVYWMQRREHPRVHLNAQRPTICEFSFSNGHIAHNPLTDISLGGMSILSKFTADPLRSGTELKNCNIILSNQEKLSCPIRICSSTTVTLDNGAQATRYGCQFFDLTDRTRSQLSLLITGHMR